MIKLYTIGHGNHPIHKFIALLNDNSIQLLVDVRSMPYSRYNPQYNRENLEHTLATANPRLDYFYAGTSLGGRPQDPGCYKHGELPPEQADYLHEVNYPEVMKRDWFQKGVDDLLEKVCNQITAILCSEEDPSACHRHHLITRYILELFPEWDIHHIRGDGNVLNARSLHVSLNKAADGQLELWGEQ